MIKRAKLCSLNTPPPDTRPLTERAEIERFLALFSEEGCMLNIEPHGPHRMPIVFLCVEAFFETPEQEQKYHFDLHIREHGYDDSQHGLHTLRIDDFQLGPGDDTITLRNVLAEETYIFTYPIAPLILWTQWLDYRKTHRAIFKRLDADIDKYIGRA